MARLSLTAALAAAALLLVVPVNGHGGQYRGPFPGIPRPRQPVQVPPAGPANPRGPTTPRVPQPSAPAPTSPGPGPALPGPTTGGVDLEPETVDWRVWWEFNKEPFLEARPVAQSAPMTGSDDFYLGPRHAAAGFDMLAPTADDRRDLIVPALRDLIEGERNRDVQSACLIALGKVALDAPGVDVEALIASRIARDDQEVRETAVLALGISARATAVPKLAGLLRDDDAGRQLVGGRVGERTRAFAAYGLGLCARANDDIALRTQIHDLLWAVLQDKRDHGFELRTAAVTALGILGGERGSGRQLRLAWQTVDELLEFFGRDLGRDDEIVQAHAPVAIARLLGRGSSAVHQRCKEQFAAAFTARPRRSNEVRQSAALALGMLCEAEDRHREDAVFAKALLDRAQDDVDRQARYFALLALGRIGGPANRERLRDAYAHSRRGTDRPWAALALGLCAARAAAAGAVDESTGRLLLGDLQDERSDGLRGALAIAVGLTGFEPAVPVVERLLHEEEVRTELAGYLCISLALLGDRAAVPQLLAIVDRSLRRPELLQQAAVALGRLGDREANDRLLAQLARTDSTATLAALAMSIARIGDRRAIAPLVAMAADRDLTTLSRAFVAAALGGVGDQQALPFHVPISVDANYAANVDTLTNGATGILDIL